MISFQITGVSAEAFVKRMVYLAWQASQVYGMGILQDRGPQTEEQVWAMAFNRSDYPSGNCDGMNKEGNIHCDYVAGRMMKFGVKWDKDIVSGHDGCNWRPDYQSFCMKYRDFTELAESTAASLNCEIKKIVTN